MEYPTGWSIQGEAGERRCEMGEVEKLTREPFEGLTRWFGEWPLPRWFDWRPELMTPLESEMRLEELREGDEYVVRAEMPGLDPAKDVDIELADHTLRIRAERRQETKSEDAKGYRSEFRYGAFLRTVPLPTATTEKDVKATYKDGILEVRVPIDEARAEGKKVPVARG
jgi:HSP20 family protein